MQEAYSPGRDHFAFKFQNERIMAFDGEDMVGSVVSIEKKEKGMGFFDDRRREIY